MFRLDRRSAARGRREQLLSGLPAFSAAVTAGGSSLRMGCDKALIVVDGAAMVQRVAAAAAAAGAVEVRAIGGDASRLRSLGLDFVADEHPGTGPLGAVVTALASTAHDKVLVLPCDLVAPSPEALAEIVGCLGRHDAAVPVVDGRAQWAAAAWASRCLPLLRAAFDSGVRAPRHALAGLTVRRFEPAEPDAFADADSPGDLRAVRHSHR